MSIFKSLSVAAALALVTPITASAATSLLEEVTVNFSGTGASGGLVLDGSAGLQPDDTVFNQTIGFTADLSTLNISHFVITLNVAGVSAAPALATYDPNGTPPVLIGGVAADGALDDGTENWFASISGGAGGDTTAFWKRLPPSTNPLEPFTFQLSAADDEPNNDPLTSSADRVDGTANTAFSRSVNQNSILLRFRERSGGEDEFELLSATVQVYEVAAPVPVPASGLLLLGAVGGVAAWKRRKSA